jgi:hypothetical protein
MSYNLLASQCPAVQVGSVLYTRAASQASSGGLAPSAIGFAPGGTTGFLGYWNSNGTSQDLTTIYGGGAVRAVCVVPGSGTPSPLSIIPLGSNLVSVAPGHARIDGIVELSGTPSNIGVSSGMNYLWLKQSAGGVGNVQVATTLTPPSGGKSCYLGAINISGGSGTPDYSGVCYTTGGGDPYRYTGDSGTPSDMPPKNICIRTRTNAGLYLWDGFAPPSGQWIGPAGSINGGTF